MPSRPQRSSGVKGLGYLWDKRSPDVFNVRVITRLTLEVQGMPYANLEGLFAFLPDAGLETGGTGSLVRPIVSCKSTTCQYGLLDSFALSEKLHNDP